MKTTERSVSHEDKRHPCPMWWWMCYLVVITRSQVSVCHGSWNYLTILLIVYLDIHLLHKVQQSSSHQTMINKCLIPHEWCYPKYGYKISMVKRDQITVYWFMTQELLFKLKAKVKKSIHWEHKQEEWV